jgi:HAD superfamily hydrolase (TIGR01490 family)
MKYRGASLFDLDHTLLKDNSSYRFGAYLYKHKKIPLSSMLYFVGCYGLHKVGKLSLQGLHEQIFIKLFKNRSLAEFQKYSHTFLDESFESMIYSPALEKLNEAKRMGQLTVILSSSPDFLVKLFAERFGVDRWAGTRYLTNSQQNLTAISEILDGEGKAKFLHALSKEMEIPTAEITAYTDSFLDLPFLKEAGHAVGVNPDNKLRAMCHQYQWDII